jgi:hypothetical protein
LTNFGIPNISIPFDLCIFLELIDYVAILDLGRLLDRLGVDHAAVMGKSQ